MDVVTIFIWQQVPVVDPEKRLSSVHKHLISCTNMEIGPSIFTRNGSIAIVRGFFLQRHSAGFHREILGGGKFFAQLPPPTTSPPHNLPFLVLDFNEI